MVVALPVATRHAAILQYGWSGEGLREMFTRLAGLVYRHRRIVVAAWLVVLVAGLVVGGSVFPRLDSSMGPDPNSESMQAQQRLEQLGGPGPNVLVLVSGRSVEDPALAAAIRRAADSARRLPGVHE